MSNQEPNKPEFSLRDGQIKVTVWRNVDDQANSIRYRTTLIKSYRLKDESGNDGDWKETDNLNPVDLLKASQLFLKAYDRINELPTKTERS